MTGAPAPRNDLRWIFLVIGIGIGLVLGILLGAFAVPPASGSTRGVSVPSTFSTATSCFGGGSCNGTGPTTNGSGTTCVVSGFMETAGDFLYVAVNYAAGTNLITSVSDGGTDSFISLAGEFAYNQSVALYGVPSDHGGAVTVTVTIGEVTFGGCAVGQLSAGTQLGVVGPGSSTPADFGLSLSNAALHEPSLLLALFGATRPTGTPFVSATYAGGSPSVLAAQWTGSTYDGTALDMFSGVDDVNGTATIGWHVGNSQTPSISGVLVEFYLAS